MKTSKIFRSLLLASTLTGFAAHAADPQLPATPSAADLQALMVLLNKLVAQAAATDSAASDEPAPPAPQPAAPVPATRQPLSTALKTGSLSTGSLTTSGGLDARGAGTFLRMTEEAWRLLFPAKQPSH